MAILLAGVFLRTPPVQIQAGLSPASVTPAWPLIVNSAVIYALSFNIIFFIQELSLALLPFLRQRSPTLRLLVLWLATTASSWAWRKFPSAHCLPVRTSECDELPRMEQND